MRLFLRQRNIQSSLSSSSLSNQAPHHGSALTRNTVKSSAITPDEKSFAEAGAWNGISIRRRGPEHALPSPDALHRYKGYCSSQISQANLHPCLETLLIMKNPKHGVRGLLSNSEDALHTSHALRHGRRDIWSADSRRWLRRTQSKERSSTGLIG